MIAYVLDYKHWHNVCLLIVLILYAKVKKPMFKLKQAAAAVAALAVYVSFGLGMTAHAVPILGSLTLSSDGVVDNGQDLATRTVFAPENLRTGLRTGDFTLVANGTPISGGVLNLDDLANFSFTITGAGIFNSAGFGNVIGQRSPTNLDVYLLGLFRPQTSGPLSTFEATDTSVRFSLTRTGAVNDFSISFSGTEAAPPADPPALIPEPISVALLGSALLALGLIRRRI